MKRIACIFIIILFFVNPNLRVNADQSYVDLNSVSWAEDAIYYLSERGIITGYGNGIFGPNDNIIREQVALILVRELYPNEKSSTALPFSDVSSSSYYYNAIAVAVDHGLFDGFTDGTFKPHDPITRAATAKILTLAYDIQGTNGSFIDLYKAPWAKDYINALASNNIVNGYDDHTFRPNNTITRAEFALSLARILDNRFKPKPKPVNPDLSTSEIAELNDRKVVLIETNRGQGSGIIVGDSLILTNEHVINGMKSGNVILNDGTSYGIEGIVKSDENKDLALIKTTQKIAGIDPVMIGTYRSLNKGDKIVAIGSLLGLQNTVSEGIVSSFRLNGGVQLIQISAPIDHGSSGGGLFNKKGELVGVTSSGYDSNADLNFAIAIDEAVDWFHYFAMDFNSIEVIPVGGIPTGGIVIPFIDGVSLGMSKEQVKNSETATLYNEGYGTLRYSNKWIFNFSANVSYVFENNRLVEIYIFHDVVNNQDNLELLETYFIVMYEQLSNLYGQPEGLDTNWFDDENGYSLSAYWVTNHHDVLLASKVNLDYTSFGGISISAY